MDSLLLQTHSDFFKTAIAEQHSIASEHRRKERRHVCILPRQNFFQNSERLLACINPSEKRMKSWFAINPDKRSTSSWRNGRKVSVKFPESSSL